MVANRVVVVVVREFPDSRMRGVSGACLLSFVRSAWSAPDMWVSVAESRRLVCRLLSHQWAAVRYSSASSSSFAFGLVSPVAMAFERRLVEHARLVKLIRDYKAGRLLSADALLSPWVL